MMNAEVVQNLRYKLQKRFRRANIAERRTFGVALKHFMCFIENNETISGVLTDLQNRFPKAVTDAIMAIKNALDYDSEDEHSCICYHVLKNWNSGFDSQTISDVGKLYTIGSNFDDFLNAFRFQFLEPLYEYIDERLDDSRVMLGLLRRYKQKCEWYCQDELFRLYSASTSKGEESLANHLYAFLLDQGIEFQIEPRSASGRADIVGGQDPHDRLVADAKVFDPNGRGKSYLAKGFRQIYEYALDHNEPIGYLMVFQVTETAPKFTFNKMSGSTPFLVYNNKTIFVVTIDICSHDLPASKRGKLQTIAILESDLIAQDVESPGE